TLISAGSKLNLRATTLMVRSRGCAMTSATSEPSPIAPAAAMSLRRLRLIRMVSAFRDRQFVDPVRPRSRLGFDLAKPEPAVRLCRVPGQRGALGLRAGGGQRVDQRLRRVVRDMPGHDVML